MAVMICSMGVIPAWRRWALTSVYRFTYLFYKISKTSALLKHSCSAFFFWDRFASADMQNKVRVVDLIQFSGLADPSFMDFILI